MTFRISGRGSMNFDVKAAKKDLNNYLREFVRQGGIKWLGATVLKVIPTWSKASRATFQKLAKDLGTSIPYGPLRSRVDREALGRANSVGSGFFNKGNEHYFVYTTQLRYLIYNEFNRATQGPPPQPFSNNVRFTPYHFQDKGDVAWEEHVRTIRLPSVWKHLS